MGGQKFYSCNTFKYIFFDNRDSNLIHPEKITIIPIRAMDKSGLKFRLGLIFIKVMARD